MQTPPLPSSLTASQMRANIYKILEEVDRKSRRFKITHKGKVKAVVMSEEEVESWEETLDITSNKKLMKDIQQADEDFRKGKYITLDELEKKIKKLPKKKK